MIKIKNNEIQTYIKKTKIESIFGNKYLYKNSNNVNIQGGYPFNDLLYNNI